MYNRKIKDFEDSIAEKEEAFARNDAIMRRNLDDEIRERRCANEAYVSDTVKRFSESYNYYLNQIKLFMDALGQVAVETGQALFSGGLADGDLRTCIGKNMVARLQVDTNPLRLDDNGMVLIGNQKNDDAMIGGPDYSTKECWYQIPEITKDVDTFFIYPSEYMGYNEGDPDYAPLDAPDMLDGVKNIDHRCMASVYEDSTNLFMPYYRQASMRHEGEVWKRNGDITEAISGIPYGDISAALDYYFENFNDGRPFIIAGHSQGSAIVKYALKHYFKEHPDYYGRMIAAYVLGYAVTKDDLKECTYLKFATGESDTGVIVSWNTEGKKNVENNVSTAVLLPNAISINPLNWKRDDTYAPASENLGSLSVNLETMEFEIADIGADAQVVPERGVIMTNAAAMPLPEDFVEISSSFFGADGRHASDYPFFYNNIKDNVAKRVAAYIQGEKL